MERTIKRAIISVFDKTGVVDFAKQLHQEFGVEILSTGGTAKTLQDAGIPIVKISDFTGAPEMFDGRVKTLHPKIHGGILWRRNNEEDNKSAKQHGILPIDLVCVNLYPFSKVIAKAETTFDEALEMIDIGGPTMIRASAKSFLDVTVICDPPYYDIVLQEMRTNKGATTYETRKKLAQIVFSTMALYDATVAHYLNKQMGGDPEFPETLVKLYKKVQSCRYGENWDQKASIYQDVESIIGLADLKQLHGKEISFNNYLDIDACIQMMIDLGTDHYVCSIFKHATPNGAAIDYKTQLDATKRAFSTDPLSAFGGVWGFNKKVQKDVAEFIVKEKNIFVEVLIAPGFEPEALEIFKTKKDIRIIDCGDILNRKDDVYKLKEMRSCLGGALVQDYDCNPIIASWDVKSKRPVSESEKKALIFAYVVSKWAKSNSAAFAKEYDTGMYTLGIGAGQQSRVHVVKLAAQKAKEFGHDLVGSVMGTDSFFPFPDGLEAAAEHGCKAILNPGGSIRDDLSIAKADELNISLVFCGKRVFRH